MTPWNDEQSIYEYNAMVYCMSSKMLKYNVLLIDAVFIMRNVYKTPPHIDRCRVIAIKFVLIRDIILNQHTFSN